MSKYFGSGSLILCSIRFPAALTIVVKKYCVFSFSSNKPGHVEIINFNKVKIEINNYLLILST